MIVILTSHSLSFLYVYHSASQALPQQSKYRRNNFTASVTYSINLNLKTSYPKSSGIAYTWMSGSWYQPQSLQTLIFLPAFCWNFPFSSSYSGFSVSSASIFRFFGDTPSRRLLTVRQWIKNFTCIFSFNLHSAILYTNCSIINIFKMKRIRLRETYDFAQGHRAKKVDLKPDQFKCTFMLLISVSTAKETL